MNQLNPFMKQMIARGKQAAPPRPAAPMPAPQPPQAAGPFLPQQPPTQSLVIPRMPFNSPAPQIPLQPPPSGPSMADQLKGAGQLNMGNWTVDPTNTSQLLQYNRTW